MKKLILLCAVLVYISSAMAQEQPHSFITKKRQAPAVMTSFLSSEEKLKLINSAEFKKLNPVIAAGNFTIDNNEILFSTTALSVPSFGDMSIVGATDVNYQVAEFFKYSGSSQQAIMFYTKVTGVYLFEVKISTEGATTDFMAADGLAHNFQAEYVAGPNHTGTLYFTASVKGVGLVSILTPKDMPVNTSWTFYSCKVTKINQ
jgi:hypothetical protein